MHRIKPVKQFFITACIFICGTQAVYANGIPAIFGVTLFHLLFINTLVIVVETFLLRRISKNDIRSGMMVLANLCSIILAYILADKTIAATLHMDWFGLSSKGVIEKKFFIAGMTAFVLFTILVEWPCYYFAQKSRRNLLSSLKYSAIINLATNIPIAIYYLATNSYYDMGD